jgi:hypothetical protein
MEEASRRKAHYPSFFPRPWHQGTSGRTGFLGPSWSRPSWSSGSFRIEATCSRGFLVDELVARCKARHTRPEWEGSQNGTCFRPHRLSRKRPRPATGPDAGRLRKPLHHLVALREMLETRIEPGELPIDRDKYRQEGAISDRNRRASARSCYPSGKSKPASTCWRSPAARDERGQVVGRDADCSEDAHVREMAARTELVHGRPGDGKPRSHFANAQEPLQHRCSKRAAKACVKSY